MSSRRAVKTNPTDLLRKLSRLPPNKTCADCPERLPQYVNSTHQTFVCTTCSGVHRSFSHRVKGVSMCEFTLDEVKQMKGAGNEGEKTHSAYAIHHNR